MPPPDDDVPGGPRVGYNESNNNDGGRHHTLYDNERNNHISWDSDRNGDYKPGTGHEDTNGSKSNECDRGRPDEANNRQG